MPRRYTPEQRDWLLGHFADMTNAELAEAFSAEFGTEATYEAMKAFGSNNHLRKEKDVARRALVRAFTAEEDSFLREFIPGHGTTEISAEFEARYGRRLTKGQITNAAARLGVRRGVNGGHFRRGHPSPTKGKTWDEIGYTPEQRERMRAGQFRKGELNGYNEGRLRALLDTRENNDGTLMIYVRPRNARFPAHHWISYARFVWMQHNGRDWPEGHKAVFADRDSRNFAPANIVPVPNDLAIIVQGGAHGHALPYHDRESLEVALNHARVIRARHAAEQRLRSASRAR